MNINKQEKRITIQETGTTLKKTWITPNLELLDTDNIRGGHVANVHEATITTSQHLHGNIS